MPRPYAAPHRYTRRPLRLPYSARRAAQARAAKAQGLALLALALACPVVAVAALAAYVLPMACAMAQGLTLLP